MDSSYLMDVLPPEVLEIIFSFCRSSDLKRLACCSTTLCQAVKEVLWSTVAIPWRCLAGSVFFTCEENKLSSLKFTKTLRIRYNHVVQAEPAKVILIENYRKLLHHCDGGILRTVFLDNDMLDSVFIKITCQTLPKVKDLTLMGVKYPTDGFNSIGKLKGLTRMNLSRSNIGDSILAIICEKVPGLKCLNIGSTKVTDGGISYLTKLKQIEELLLPYLQISETGLAHIGALVSLRKLNLHRCHYVNDRGLVVLSNLTSLKELDLSYCDQVSHGIGYIPSLVILNKSRTIMTDASMASVSPLKNLKKLDVSHCSLITDTGVFFISKVSTLEDVDISWTSVTDCGLMYLVELTFLRTLSCSRTFTTEEGVNNLIKKSSIKSIER